MNEHFDIIIVGGGPAGLTAAIYARRAGKTVLVLEKAGIGGQIASSPKVENFPGFSGISGAELAERLYAQVDELGARIELEEVLSVSGNAPKTVTTDYNTYTCTALVLATGMKHRTLGLDGEDTLSGISFCAVCDGAFYEGKDVAICGGGNSALQEALFLSQLCSRVTVIHRRNQFRADPVLVEAINKKENIDVVLCSVVEKLENDGTALSGLVLRNVDTEELTTLPVDGFFEAVGFQPEEKLAKMLKVSDENGFILTDNDCITDSAGVFAAGDCRSKNVRQLVTACADGAVAALAACEYCEH